jgi:hypothetical protein
LNNFSNSFYQTIKHRPTNDLALPEQTFKFRRVTVLSLAVVILQPIESVRDILQALPQALSGRTWKPFTNYCSIAPEGIQT